MEEKEIAEFGMIVAAGLLFLIVGSAAYVWFSRAKYKSREQEYWNNLDKIKKPKK